ncbi:MAG: DUF2147 domain-containing protein [Pseudomonadota bacterium]
MKKLISTTCAALFVVASTTLAISAEPIEGNWKTKSGETAGISKCGGSFCIKLKTGTHAGKQIGKLKGSGANYNGTITDPEDNKEYTGSAKVGSSSMKLKGCALKIFCQTQTWKRL